MTKDKLTWRDWSRKPEAWPDAWRGAAEGEALGTNVTETLPGFYNIDIGLPDGMPERLVLHPIRFAFSYPASSLIGLVLHRGYRAGPS